jgi:hypothetical protein
MEPIIPNIPIDHMVIEAISVEAIITQAIIDIITFAPVYS